MPGGFWAPRSPGPGPSSASRPTGTCGPPWSRPWARPGRSTTSGGFPPSYSPSSYPAPGSPALAEEIRQRLAPLDVGLDQAWGLDHGTWSVLVHMFPEADIPVVQLSIDRAQPGSFHYRLGAALARSVRRGRPDHGSGNLVHNLETYAWGGHPAEPFDWALRFDDEVRGLLDDGRPRSPGQLRTDGPRRPSGRSHPRSFPAPALRHRRRSGTVGVVSRPGDRGRLDLHDWRSAWTDTGDRWRGSCHPGPVTGSRPGVP